jgi:hypothetical protein
MMRVSVSSFQFPVSRFRFQFPVTGFQLRFPVAGFEPNTSILGIVRTSLVSASTGDWQLGTGN